MKSLVPKTSLVGLIAAAAFAVCFAQSEIRDVTGVYKGKVRLVTASREFWIRGGRPIPPQSLLVFQKEYDKDGYLIRHSIFGNVEQRNLYSFTDGKWKIDVHYFDSKGQRIAPEKASFVSNIERPNTGDLCSAYSTKYESDPKAGIRRIIDICENGSTRSTQVIDENAGGTYLRILTDDAKGRTYEHTFIYEEKDVLKETRYVANDLKSPKFFWNQTYVNHKFDSVGNLIEMIGTGIHSSRPNQASIQFFDRYEFVYFDR